MRLYEHRVILIESQLVRQTNTNTNSKSCWINLDNMKHNLAEDVQFTFAGRRSGTPLSKSWIWWVPGFPVASGRNVGTGVADQIAVLLEHRRDRYRGPDRSLFPGIRRRFLHPTRGRLTALPGHFVYADFAGFHAKIAAWLSIGRGTFTCWLIADVPPSIIHCISAQFVCQSIYYSSSLLILHTVLFMQPRNLRNSINTHSGRKHTRYERSVFVVSVPFRLYTADS